VTRIFDALSKGRPAPPVRDPATPPALAAVPPRATHTVERPVAPGGGMRVRVVALGRAAGLPPDVLREMTGLRVSLEGALTQRIPRTVFLVASQGGEGTSTVAAQFAQVLAADDRLRVLVVDAHARRPAYEPGGTLAVLRDARSSAQDARNLDLMPLEQSVQGDRSVTPESLRASLDAVSSGYDWILVDGPPVLESPDAASLGAVADGVLVVVQAGRTKRPVLARSVDLLNRAGSRVLGVVLNRRRLEIPEFIYRRI